ncbi:helix-turn-helix domain-containing protein [Candidatus Binatus sp.]|uniref:helix-turn-helix domain-containing protein n=1 Tax=Candidatus Binatus sp. TaxID=2811406 RepID=UPI003CC68E6C
MNAKELKRCREKLGLSQVELAKKVGVHPMTVSRWQRGMVPVPEPAARLLALLVSTQSRRGKR